MQYLTLGLRCLLGAVFLIAAVSKVAGREAFASFAVSLRRMRLLPNGLVRPVAALVVGAELTAGAALAWPTANGAPGFALAATLLILFAAGIGRAVRLDIREPCRCFGPSETPLGRPHIVRNAVLAAVACVGLWGAQQPAPLHASGVIVAVSLGLLAAAATLLLDDITELLRPL
ncbi:MauE/DoxX family redox-associated membrane protein [Micromonospora peucetia]|uniref:Methylamine utilisation protein MauE n=1 Tax=Micromonospora peucetia TaxID=47871 RepID=A0A1C6VUL4_9ACTN|nr:MauE/DoxX family redox-associated membrane protein [Micromonospora peucetia]SCL69877.1 Methylamine utilisation protein MauE [Micromonospora peucetia]